MTAEQEEAARKCARLARQIEALRRVLHEAARVSDAVPPGTMALATMERELKEAQAALKALEDKDDA